MAQNDTNIPYLLSGPLDVARSVIDHDIAQLQENIRALKSRRNGLAPISRLPPEILCNIFSFIETRDFGVGQVWSPDSWVSFSRVSQHWRTLALSAPELWTNIPFKYPRWAEEMLTRSKMAKLTVRVDAAYQSANCRAFGPIKSCLSQTIRLGEINISMAPRSTLEKLLQDLPKSAPQLHTLRITCHLSEPPYMIDEDFLRDTARLRCVNLVNCKISWDSRLLTGLTRLTLHGSLKKDDENSSIVQFFHALERMPALTNLDLEDAIPHNSGITTCPAVHLPCLEVLNISSDVGAMTAALRHMTFPSNAVLSLTCQETRPTQIDFSNFLSALAAKFLSSHSIRSLSLHILDHMDGLRFGLWPTVQDFLYSRGFVTPCLDLVLKWTSIPHTYREYAKVLTAAFDVMDLHALTRLNLSTGNSIDSKTWLKTFGKLPLLEQVHVQSFAAQSFFDAVVHKTKAANKSIAAYRTVSFPRLRSIYMVACDFSEPSLGSISVEMLMDYLMERCERNAEVHELHLDDCYHIMAEDVERLREIVVDVHWDRLVQGFSDEYDSEEDRDYDSDGNTIDDFDYDYDDFPFGGGRHWLTFYDD